MRNPLEILGVPRALAQRAVELDDLSVVNAVVKGVYRTLSRAYHPDASTGDAKLMSELAEAYEDVSDPVGLKLAVGLYVGQSDQLQADASRDQERRSRRNERVARSLAQTLVAVDQLAVLGAERRVRFIAALGLSALHLNTPSPPYFTALMGEASSHALKAWWSTPSDDIMLSGQPRFVASRGVWSDSYGESSQRSRRFFHDQATQLAGALRIVGAADRAALREAAQLSSAGYEAMERLSLKSVSPETERLVWAGLAEAWWLSALQPRAVVGDHLVVMNLSSEEPMFALTGPLMAVRGL